MHTRCLAFGAMVLAAGAVSRGATYAAPRSQDPAGEIPRSADSTLHPLQVYHLPGGGTVEHERYKGLVRRLDASGKEIARGKVPAAHPIEKDTTLVFSSDLTRMLMIHTISDFDFRAKHRVAVLETERLRTIAELPLGSCRTPGPFPLSAEHLTMVCYHSRPPGDRTQKPTLAVVTVNIARGEVVRWFPLGGRRKGTWVGPMFFGWRFDVQTVTVREGTYATCPSFQGAPAVVPGKRKASELVLVLNRDASPPQTEVWSVSARHTEEPRRVTVFAGKADYAVLCDAAVPAADVGQARLVYVVLSNNAAAPAENTGAFLTADGQPIHIVEVAAGRRFGR